MNQLPLRDKFSGHFRFATPQPVLVNLHHIDRDAAGQIRAPEGASIHQNRQPYLLASLVEEAITSSQLEGAEPITFVEGLTRSWVLRHREYKSYA